MTAVNLVQLAVMASRGRGYRTFVVAGHEILVGKRASDNDRLTFDLADLRDFWLHVAGVPGSHVIVRNPDGLSELPREVLEAAGQLAAFHSKAQGARGKVEVHVCRAADVSKPRGFAPGEVRLKRWDTIKVYPRDLSALEST